MPSLGQNSLAVAFPRNDVQEILHSKARESVANDLGEKIQSSDFYLCLLNGDLNETVSFQMSALRLSPTDGRKSQDSKAREEKLLIKRKDEN